MCLKFWQQTFRGHAKKYHFFLLEIPPEIIAWCKTFWSFKNADFRFFLLNFA